MIYAKLLCLVFGHQYQVWQHFSRISRRVVCNRCGGDWGMHDEVRAFVPWSGEMTEMYERFGHRIRARPHLQHGESKA